MTPLTIGMATFDDADGCLSTLYSLRLHHDVRDCEVLVVDNQPASPRSVEIELAVTNFRKSGLNARYIPMAAPVGTCPPRNRVFAEATGEAVLCLDSHVLLPAGVISKLRQWYADHPDSFDLLSGPLVLDAGEVRTHYNDIWRRGSWGVWGSAWQAPGGGPLVSPVRAPAADRIEFFPLAMNPRPIAGLPEIAYANFPTALEAAGFKPLGYDDADAFEIPGMGLGAFSCRRAAWLGFNEHFRGFGGGEFYIHEKFRRAGRRCLCLGFLKWIHWKWNRPQTVAYPALAFDKARNLVVGHDELDLPRDTIQAQFSGLLTPAEWSAIAADPIGVPSPAPPPPIAAGARRRLAPASPADGPGTELAAIFAALGIKETLGCNCPHKIVQMNAWGVAGCKNNRHTIIGWLKDGQAQFAWKDKLAAAASLPGSGLLSKLGLRDPLGGLVDEAISRAHAKANDRTPKSQTVVH